MIKFFDKRDLTIKELPTLPFMSQFNGDFYLYYEDTEENITCICMSTGVAQTTIYDNIREAVEAMTASEKIVEVEFHIVK
jgi:hypothetical protein